MENKKDIISFIKSVIDKKFETKDKGYNPTQVDQTLDEIFEVFSDYIVKYNELVEKLKRTQDQYANLSTEYETLDKRCKMYREEITRYESSGISLHMLKKEINDLKDKKENDEDKKDK